MARSPEGKEKLRNFPCLTCKHPKVEHISKEFISQPSSQTCIGCLRDNKCLSKDELAVLFKTNQKKWKIEANKHLSVCYRWFPMDNLKYVEFVKSRR